jgi:hypothetical protein
MRAGLMGRSQRVKGAVGEREVANIIRAVGLDVDRVPNSGGLRVKGDLTGLDGFHLEVKRQETLCLPKWLRQAHDEAADDEVPVVIFRQSKRVGNVGEWHACLPLAGLLDLLRRAA